MASAADVREIMGMAPLDTAVTKDTILGTDRRKSSKKAGAGGGGMTTRPEGMHRELYNLLYSENKELPCPLIATDTSKDQGYKQMRAKLGMRRVRPWKWTPFTNPARKDSLVLHHWRRQVDEGKEYPFARFNKSIEVPNYSEAEYASHLVCPGWTREETDHLMDLAQRFDLRFIVMADRWDRDTFSLRSVEDLKERYYSILERLEKVHGPAGNGEQAATPTTKKTAAAVAAVFDADHERRRKEQLRRLYARTPAQIDEEEMLRTELRKIEARKREREKKTADLQKLIAQADTSVPSSSAAAAAQHLARKKMKKICKKQKLGGSGLVGRPSASAASGLDDAAGELSTGGIRWPDAKSGGGVSVRSARIKLPISVGLKKTKAIESMLGELGVPAQPPATDPICTELNELRSEMVLLYELKTALTGCEYELASLRSQYEGLVPGKTLEIPEALTRGASGGLADGAAAAVNASSSGGGERKKNLADVIDLAGSTRGDSLNVNRKRKAALEQGNILKKIKKRTYQ